MVSSSSSVVRFEFIVGGKYCLVCKIGSGFFGDIYLVVMLNNLEEVVVKFEF